MLLEQRHQEIDGQVDVVDQLVFCHAHVSDGNVQTQDLLHLELDGGGQVEDLSLHVVVVGQEGGELASLVQTGSQQTRDLLDQRLGSQESIVLLGQLLDKLLVLVKLLQIISAHSGDVLALGLVNVSLVSQNAHGELGPWDMLQPSQSIS